uniref:VWFA domain-containing protein n=1 Tax=Plectus sambesii TaxID=2011161 RepID=A0A914X7Q1_9BILA
MCGGRSENIVRVPTWTALSNFSATTVTDKIDCQPPPIPSGCDRSFHFGTGVHATFAGGMTTGLAPLNSTVTLSCNGPIFIPIPSLVLDGSCTYDPVTFNFVWKIQSSGPYCKIDPKFGCPRNLSTAIFGPGSVVEYSTGSTVIKKPTNTGTGSSCSLSAVDLAFVVDQSGSIQESNWPKVIKFLKDFTDQLTIGTASTESQVGCVKFNQEGELVFHLNDYTTATTLKDELDLSYDGGYTNIEDGLFVAIDEVFDSAEGDRPDVPNVIILLTDGKDDSDCESMYNLAQSKNIDILAIGIGNGVDEEQLKKCVGGDESKIFTVDDFDGLDELTTSICSNITKSSNATEVAPVGTNITITCQGPAYVKNDNADDGFYTCEFIDPDRFEWSGLDPEDPADEPFCKLVETLGCPRNITASLFGDGAKITYSDGETDPTVLVELGGTVKITCDGPAYTVDREGPSAILRCLVDNGEYYWLGLDSHMDFSAAFCKLDETLGCPSNITSLFGDHVDFHFNVPGGIIKEFLALNSTVEIGCMGPAYYGVSFTITCEIIGGHFEWFGLDEAINGIDCKLNTTFGCPSDIKNWFDVDVVSIHFDFDGAIGDFFEEGVVGEIGCFGPVFFGASFKITCKVIEGHFEWEGLDEAKNITCERNMTFGCPSDIKSWFDIDIVSIHFDFDGEIGDFFDEGVTAEIGCLGPVYFGASLTITCKVIEGHFEWFGLDEAKNITCERNTTFGCPSDIKNWFDMDGVSIHFDFDGAIGDFFDEGISAEIGCMGPVFFGASLTITCKVIEGHFEWFGLDEAKNITCERNTTFGCPSDIKNWFDMDGAFIHFDFDGAIGDFFDEGITAEIGCLGPAYIGAHFTITCKVIEGHYEWFGLDEAVNGTYCELDKSAGCSRNISEEIFGAGAVVKFSDNGVGDVSEEGVDMIVSCDAPKFIPVNGTASVSFTCTIDGKGDYVWFGLAEAEADFPFCECACYCPAL